ncbi:MAG TPA: aminopeptidase P family N-terminal domain-containing protein, partial [Thermomicrobiales bacterium]|nr:aminopeptidase P family N-terminal domain-containing protein [Thermomicrobiales bacterium]
MIERLKLDLVILTQNAHVQYFVGPRLDWKFSPAAAIAADGRVMLVAPAKPADEVAADDILTYEAQSFSTLRNDQRQKSTAVLFEALARRPRPKRVGVEFSS